MSRLTAASITGRGLSVIRSSRSPHRSAGHSPAVSSPPHVDVAQRRDRGCGVPFRSFRARFVRRVPPLPSSSTTGIPADESEHTPVAHGRAMLFINSACLAEVVREVRIDHFVAAPVQQAVDPPDRVLGASSRPVSILLRLQIRLEVGIITSIADVCATRWHGMQGTELPRLFLRDERRTGLGSGPATVPRSTLRTPRCHRHTIDSSRSAVAPDQRPCRPQEVLPPYLVDKGVKSPSGFFLRFRM